MKKSIAGLALATLGFCGTLARGQSNEEKMMSEIRALRERLDRVERENGRLQGRVDLIDDGALESEISTLIARRGATIVKSVANPITLTGEFRFRYAWSFGDNAPGATPNGPNSGFTTPDDEHGGNWVDALMRIGLQYDFNKDVTAYSEFRTRWAFGGANSTSLPLVAPTSGGTTVGGTQAPATTGLPVQTFLFIHQAWLETRDIFGLQELSNRTGRQEIILGNQFQFGNSDWYNGFSFDATRFDWTAPTWSLTGIVSTLNSLDSDANQVSSFFNSHDDDTLYALYFTLNSVTDHKFDAYWIYIDGHGGAHDNGSGRSIGALGNFVSGQDSAGGTSYYHTFGVRGGGVFPDVVDGLDWNLEGAYQIGSEHVFNGADKDISAAAVEGEVGVTFDRDLAFRVYARVLWATGPGDGELAYTPLYPNRHTYGGYRARYGMFDLIPMSNVFTPQIGLSFTPASAWTFGATGLWARADTFGNTPGTSQVTGRFASVPGADYGFEGDIWGEYRHSDQLTFGGGLGLLFPGDAGEALWAVDEGMQVMAFFQARLVF